MVTENDKDYEAIKNIALHQNEEQDHTQELTRAIYASIKQQGEGNLLTSSMMSKTLPKTDRFKDAIHKAMCTTDRINQNLIINQQPTKQIRRMTTPIHIDELIGRAIVDTDNESSTLASNIARIVVDSLRRLLFQKPLKITKGTDSQAANLIKKLVPDSDENWATTTIEEAITAQGGLDNLIQSVSDFFALPLLIAIGSLKAGEYKGKKTAFFNTESLKIYGSNHAATQTVEGSHAAIAITKNGKECFKFNTFDKKKV